MGIIDLDMDAEFLEKLYYFLPPGTHKDVYSVVFKRYKKNIDFIFFSC